MIFALISLILDLSWLLLAVRSAFSLTVALVGCAILASFCSRLVSSSTSSAKRRFLIDLTRTGCANREPDLSSAVVVSACGVSQHRGTGTFSSSHR